MEWEMRLAAPSGIACVALWVARKLALVTMFHWSSDFAMKSKTEG